MLQHLRNPRYFKWVMWAAIIVVIPSFVLFYGFSSVDQSAGPRVTGPLVTVDTDQGEVEISANELQFNKRELINARLLDALRIGVPQEQLPMVQSAFDRELDWREVAEYAISEVALRTRLEEQNYRVSDDQVAEVLRNQGVTRESIRQELERRRITEYQLAAEIRNNILENISNQTISRLARTSLLELWQEYLLENEMLDLAYARIPVEVDEDYVPSDEEVAQEYAQLVEDENPVVTVGDRYVYEYVKIPAPATTPQPPTQEELEAEYAAIAPGTPGFFSESGTQVRQLLIATSDVYAPEQVAQARERAEAARQRIIGGEQFAAVADALSEDPRNLQFDDALSTPTLLGGLIPYRFDGSDDERAAWGDAWVDAMASLPVGQVSEVLETPQGFAVIQVESRGEAEKLPFAEVRDQIRRDLMAERREAMQVIREEEMANNLETLRTAAAVETTLQGIARQVGTTVQRTSPTLTSAVFIPGIGNLGNERESLRVLAPERISPVLQTSASDVVVLRIAETLPQSARPLDEVREQIVQRLRRREAAERAQALAEELRASVGSNDMVTTKGLELGYEVQELEPFARANPPQELLRAAGLPRDLLGANEGDLLVHGVGAEDFRQAYLVLQVVDVQEPSRREFLDNLRTLERNLLDVKREAFVQEFRRDAIARLDADFDDAFFGQEDAPQEERRRRRRD